MRLSLQLNIILKLNGFFVFVDYSVPTLYDIMMLFTHAYA